jgi:medium-chain acyl-[acyl-carrier-protein] hydrolase
MVLFCFPYAGGSPYVFREWRSRLQPEIQVAALQSPGRGMRIAESPYHAVGEIVTEVMDGLAGLGDRPFAFYGHSLGALVAFEAARQLRREGRPQPLHLFVGSARPPDIGPLMPPLHHLPETEFLSALQARYSGVPAAILDNPEILSIFLPALRADFTAYERHEYQTEPPLGCPISSFVGEEDKHISAETMAGWKAHTSAAFALQVFRGGHFFMDEDRDHLIDTIARQLL